MNAGLWAHPRTAESIDRLSTWRVEIVDPDLGSGSPRLASTEAIVEVVRRRLASA
jgi:phosphopantothenoylcysteine synthetase/decarboxylase